MIANTVKRLSVEVASSGKEPEYIVPAFVYSALLKAAVSTIKVETEWYLKTYPDVADAIKGGKVADAGAHYHSYGYFENRFPHQIKVDEKYYLKSNPDVADAIKDGKWRSGQEHFEKAGFSEGRLPYPDFSLF